MGCSVYQDKISDYIDDLLPAVERQQMESHFAACPPCYAVYQDLLMICQASRNLPEHEPREIVWERIRAEISPRQAGPAVPAHAGWIARWLKSPTLGAWSWQPAIAAAAMVFLGLATILYYRSSTPPPVPIASGIKSWSNGTRQIEIQPTNRLIVHKPIIEVDIVQQHIDELQRQIQTAQTRWSPEVQALYQRHLQAVDHCLNNCQKTNAAPGDDPAARAVYQAALRAKLEMLKQFADM
jgi:hypothetical protein